MSQYSSGKHAFGICDRTGMRYKLHDLVDEYRFGVKTGLRVGKDVVDPDHPQNFIGRLRINDPQALRNPRPDVSPGRELAGWDPVGQPEMYMTASAGRVSVVLGRTAIISSVSTLTASAGSVVVNSDTTVLLTDESGGILLDESGTPLEPDV